MIPTDLISQWRAARETYRTERDAMRRMDAACREQMERLAEAERRRDVALVAVEQALDMHKGKRDEAQS